MFAAYFRPNWGWIKLFDKGSKYTGVLGNRKYELTVWSLKELAEEIIRVSETVCFVTCVEDLTRKELDACMQFGALSRGVPTRARVVQKQELKPSAIVLVVIPTSVFSEKLLVERLQQSVDFGFNIQYALEDLLGEYV